MTTLTPEQVVQGTSAQYGIVWEMQEKGIVPQEVHGDHSFVEESKNWKFNFGEGCVGRAYAKHETLIVEDAVTGESMFMRKSIAKRYGINAVVFVPQPDGSVLEIGFERKLSELPQSWWMRNIVSRYAKDSESKKTEDIHRMRTPSPSSLLNAQSPSLRALACVAIGIDRSLAMLPVAEHLDGKVNRGAYLRAQSLCSSTSSSDVSWVSEGVGADEGFGLDDAVEREFDVGGAELPKAAMQVDLASHIPIPTSLTKSSQPSKGNKEFDDSSLPNGHACQPNNVAQCDNDYEDALIALESYFGSRLNSNSFQAKLQENTREEKDESCRFGKHVDLPKPTIQVDLASYIPSPMPVAKSLQMSMANDIFVGLDASYNGRSQQSLGSVGSVGHPEACGGACKYLKSQKGCKLGAACDRCHLCVWTRASEREMAKKKNIYSLGSVGHPHSCAAACKYHTRKECKQGSSCDRCHLCAWTRAGERALARQKNVKTRIAEEESQGGGYTSQRMSF